MTKVINLVAGPSAGKSTNAMGLTSYLKTQRLNAEYVDEFAKGQVWDESFKNLDDQLYLLGNQNHMLYRLKDKVDIVVTDSPLILSLYYYQTAFKKFHDEDDTYRSHFERLVLETVKQYDNIYYVIDRGDRKFIEAGRLQKEERGKQIDKDLIEILKHYFVRYKTVQSWNDIISDKDFLNILS